MESHKKSPQAGAKEETKVYSFFVYSRPAGEKRFLLTDLARGTVGMGKAYAPRYRKDQLDQLRRLLDLAAAANPGAVFQLRRLNGRSVVYATDYKA